MSDTHHGVMVLMSAVEAAGLDRDAAIKLAGGDLVDETEGSLTFHYGTAAAAKKGAKALTGKGLKDGEGVFVVQAIVPEWLGAYADRASNMVEHGG